MTRAGWLRHRVVIEERGSVARNAVGEEIVTWSEVVTLWAGIEPTAGREYRAPDSEQAEMTTRIRCRYYPGITPVMRARWTDANDDEHMYDILSVARVREAQRDMILVCRELTPA